jgi:Zn-dependent protease with chaperone function
MQMLSEQEVTRSKWLTILTFLTLDILQIAFVSILSFDESLAWIISFDLSLSNPIVSISLFGFIILIQLILAYYLTLGMMRSESMVQIYPKLNTEEEWECRYTRDQIVNWTLELAKESEVNVSKIYLMKSPLPNAFTFSLPLVGSVVVVHSNILDLLGPIEVRAIIAHEIGHIKNMDSIVSILTRMPSFFIDIVYIYLYLRIGLGFATALFVDINLIVAGIRIIMLIGFFLFSRLLMAVSKLLMQKASRNAELLGDLHAAKIIGAEPTINALIRLGQRFEVISVLVDEIRWLESLNPERTNPVTQEELTHMIMSYPLDGIEEDVARQAAPWIFLSTRLRKMREVYRLELSDEQIKESVTPATEYLLSARAKSTALDQKLGEELKTIDWRDVDYNGDRRLSSEELVDLLSILRKNPSKLMFDSESGKNILMLDHPDFRSRLIFLADIFNI